MKYNIGDKVAFSFYDHCIDINASIAFIEPRNSIFKGVVTDIKFYDFFLFKRKHPKYKVCNIWVQEKTLKRLITIPAMI